MKSRLSKYMEFYNITQKELSEATGINRNTIGRYTNNTFESINKDHLDLLCSFFKCSLDELFIVDNALDVKYTSVVVEQSINRIPFPVSHPNKPLIITGDDALNNAKQFEETSNYDPTFNDDECYEMELAQDRLDMEYTIEDNLNSIINNILFNTNFLTLPSKIQSEIEAYEQITNMPFSFKFILIYRSIYFIIVKQMYNKQLVDFLSKIRKIYNNGGLLDLTDKELEELTDESVFLLKDLEYKNKD